MNDMRKLMEAVKVLGEDFDEYEEEEAHYDMKNADVEKFEGRKIYITDLYDGDIYGLLDGTYRFMLSAPMWRDMTPPSNVTDDEIEIHDADFSLSSEDEDLLRRWYMAGDLDEAYQGGKTEHSGAKKGKGAFYGRKKDAKQDSKKNRRKADKDASVEETVEIIGEAATGGQWEIAINNLIGDGDGKFVGGAGDEENVWNWVRNELHGMLDFQPEGMGESVELDEGRQFVDSAAMVMWMLGALERMQLDYNYGGEVEEQFEGVMSAIEDLINEMKDAEIKQYPSRPTHGRRPGPRG